MTSKCTMQSPADLSLRITRRTVKDFLIENAAYDLFFGWWKNRTAESWDEFISTPIMDEKFRISLGNTLRELQRLDIQKLDIQKSALRKELKLWTITSRKH